MVQVHLDLSHVQDTADLVLEVHGATFALSSHSDSSLLTATQDHQVLAAMPADRRCRFSHFADLDEATLTGDGNCVRWIRVVRPAAEGSHLPEVVLLSHFLPEHQLRAHARRMITVAGTPWGGSRPCTGPGWRVGRRCIPASSQRWV